MHDFVSRLKGLALLIQPHVFPTTGRLIHDDSLTVIIGGVERSRHPRAPNTNMECPSLSLRCLLLYQTVIARISRR
jgi:hypothetical protein